MCNKRVLFADDVEAIRQMLELLLRDQPFESVLTADGEVALQQYYAAVEQERPFDLLVLDVVMPRLSGLGVAEAIRMSGDTTTPIVLWTAEDSPLVDMRARSVTITEIWPKVDDPAVLLGNIGRMLEGASPKA